MRSSFHGSSRGAFGAVIALALAACHAPDSRAYGEGSAQVTALLSSATASQTAAVAKVTVVVSAGDGPDFRSLTVDLEQRGSSWNALVDRIPAGPGRHFDAVARDATDHVICSGSGKADILPKGTATLSMALVVPGVRFGNAAPVIDSISSNASSVAPGAVAGLSATAHDPDGDPITYRWSASCGAFDTPTSAAASWTAPGAGPATCELTLTVSDDWGASSSASVTIVVPGPRAVTGARLVTSWPDPPAQTATAPAPDVATATAPSALVQDAAGQWSVFAGGTVQPDGSFAAGHFGADGSFVIPRVPAGSYALCYALPNGGMACSETDADQVDLGYDVLGRPDQTAATQATPVTLALAGLDAWNPITDQIQLTSSSANLWDVAGSVGALQGGTTGGTVTEDWHRGNGSGTPLDLLGPPDVLFVHQLSTRSIDAANTILFYAAATHAVMPSQGGPGVIGIALVDGQPASVDAAMTPLPLTASFDLQWDLGQFEAHRTAMGPAARISLGAKAHTFRVGANAFQLEYPAPASSGSPELVRFGLPAGLGQVAGTLYYGRFLPALWREWWEASFAAEVSYLAPGATAPLGETAVVERREAPPVSGVVVPAVSPVLAPLVNGVDAYRDATGVGLTPVLSWSPPAVGVPTAHVIEVYKLGTSGGATTSSLALRYVTRAATVTVPPGVLEVGGTYYAKITAEVSTIPYAVAPFRRANVYARATVLTGTFAP